MKKYGKKCKTLAEICKKYAIDGHAPTGEPLKFDIVSGIDIHGMKHWGQYTGVKNCNGYRVITSQGLTGTQYRDTVMMLRDVNVLFSPQREVRLCNANQNH